MSHIDTATPPGRLGLTICASVFVLLGLLTAGGGGWLVALGGSPYYLLAGLGTLVTGVLLFGGRRAALWLYALLLLASTIWALCEVGLDWWQWLPRLDLWFVLGLALLLPGVRKHLRKPGPHGGQTALLSALGIVALVSVVSLFAKSPTEIDGRLQRGLATVLAQPGPAVPARVEGDWPSYGGDSRSQHYSPLTQITPRNAGQLRQAWVFRTGDMPGPEDSIGFTDQNTPLKIGNTLYVCTPHSMVIALNATTGQEQWRFDPHIRSANGSFKSWGHMTCRGVSYHDDAAYATATPAASASCPRRLFLPTADVRLIALNADDGRICTDFGDHGTVNLLTDNLGGTVALPGSYYSTSPPAVTRDLVILGGFVTDNYSTHEASGVVRAFDVHDGHLVWNWDAGNPEQTAPLLPGQHYTVGSPNVWPPISVDEKLGLVYLPMGNQTPDQWGAQRSAGAETYSAGLVALELASGQVRWHYQFTHHDLWDHDVPAQPVLVDLKTATGVQPAVISVSKQASIYVLNRATGAPIVPIHEVPVPTVGQMPGERPLSPTQPTSELNYEMPRLTEAAMWGTTPLDQLYCRIQFRSVRYEGPFTPPSVQGSLEQPGINGGFDWGGLSIDPIRQIAFTNPNNFAFYSRLIPRAEVDAMTPEQRMAAGAHLNLGAPYGVALKPLMTPWGVPCQAPPWGWVSLVDLSTHKIIWKHKNGDTRGFAPLSIPLPLGVPGQGGTVITAGGVAFFGAAVDYLLRAYDVTDGRTLWQARLPAGGQATPLSYLGADGRQYVVIVAGGHAALGTKLGDYVVAYALPKP